MIGYLAAALTLIGLWLLGSRSAADRCGGFVVGALANVIWMILYLDQPPLVIVNGALFLVNFRGYFRNS